MDQLKNKVAVVTGGASGIGLALARRFHAEGMRVAVADVDRSALHSVPDAFDGNVVTKLVDVRDPVAVEAFAEKVFADLGVVHILCNNAGVSGASPDAVWELPLETWEWVIGVNLMGIVHGLRAFVPRMLRSGEPGHIVNTASLAGLVVFPAGGAYGPSKHAAVALTELTALELQARGAPIAMSVLCPAWVNTAILDDEAHRPEPLRVDRAHRMPESIRQRLASSMAETGLAPEAVASATIDAIRTGRFYVLPNAEWTPAVAERGVRIAHDGPVAPPPMPT
jgi:NAD(P)-dependent dehydrogenase (short-subunit alcohol dehydrogenase family)